MSVSPHYRWLIVATTLVNQAFSVGILIYSFALFVVPWLEEFSVSRGQIMLAIFALQVSVGLVSPLLGRLLDNRSLRWLFIGGAVCTSSGLLLLSQATAFWQVLLIHATLMPIGMGLCGTLASQTLVSKWFTSNRGMAIGISAMGTSLGGFVFPLVTSSLLVTFAWQGTLMFHAALCFFVLLPLNYLVLSVEPPVRELDTGTDVSLDNRVWTTPEILKTRMFWLPVIGLVPINAAFGGVQFNLGAYVSDLGMTQSFAAQLIAVTAVSMIVGKFLFGSLGDKMDHRHLYWLMFMFMSLALLMYMGEPGRTELFVAAALQGMATGGVLPMMGIVYASRFGTLSFGRVVGLVNLFLMTGSFGSILSGWIFDATGSYDVAFKVFLVCIVPAAIAIYWLPPPPPQFEDSSLGGSATVRASPTA
ncbi:MAG: MFS family permease [Candidatus Azotimanducaceae bacterium]